MRALRKSKLHYSFIAVLSHSVSYDCKQKKQLRLSLRYVEVPTEVLKLLMGMSTFGVSEKYISFFKALYQRRQLHQNGNLNQPRSGTAWSANCDDRFIIRESS